jgi:hypothetical protein
MLRSIDGLRGYSIKATDDNIRNVYYYYGKPNYWGQDYQNYYDKD